MPSDHWIITRFSYKNVFAGRGEGENPRGGAGRGGAKERVNRLIQKFDKSAYIVMEIFVVYYDVLINENIISSHF